MSLPVDKLVFLGFTYIPDQLSGIYLWLKEKEVDTKGKIQDTNLPYLSFPRLV